MMPAKVVGIASEVEPGADAESSRCSCCSCRRLPRVDARVLRVEADDAEVLAFVLLLVARFGGPEMEPVLSD